MKGSGADAEKAGLSCSFPAFTQKKLAFTGTVW
jgi:hypothetical protein